MRLLTKRNQICLAAGVALAAPIVGAPPSGALTCAPEDYSVWVDLSGDSQIQVEEYVCVPQYRPFEEATTMEEVLHTVGFDRRDADILRLYEAFFARSPDIDGAIYWLEVGDNSRTQFYNPVEAIAGWFGESDEFHQTYDSYSDREFVIIVYANVLGRDPDPAGLAYWIDLMDTGGLTRTELVFYFSRSPEFRDQHLYRPLWQMDLTPRLLENGETVPGPEWIPAGI